MDHAEILWLHQQSIKPKLDYTPNKLSDRKSSVEAFLNLFEERRKNLTQQPEVFLEFKKEMLRFLPAKQGDQVLAQEQRWSFMTFLINDLGAVYNSTLLVIKH